MKGDERAHACVQYMSSHGSAIHMNGVWISGRAQPEAWISLVVRSGGVNAGPSTQQVEVVIRIEAGQVTRGPKKHTLAALQLN